MPLLFSIALRYLSVRFKKRDVSESHCVGVVVDQGMRDGKGVHTIRDSYCHRKTGAEKA